MEPAGIQMSAVPAKRNIAAYGGFTARRISRQAWVFCLVPLITLDEELHTADLREFLLQHAEKSPLQLLLHKRALIFHAHVQLL